MQGLKKAEPWWRSGRTAAELTSFTLRRANYFVPEQKRQFSWGFSPASCSNRYCSSSIDFGPESARIATMSSSQNTTADWRGSIYPVLAIDQGSASGNAERNSSGCSVLDDSSIEENGRTYHSYKQGAYFLPNDAEEQERLDIQHKSALTLLDGKLALAPLEQPRNVLDLATGTGIWAIEFAKRYPQANVIGSDLSLIQPSNVVDNCSFIKEDAEGDEWTYNCLFDYIHLRFMVTCFNDITGVLQKIYDHLEPGGWVEFQESTAEILSTDGSATGSTTEIFSHAIIKGLARLGKDATWIRSLRDRLAAQGFIDITERIIPYPIGAWPEDPKFKEAGKWMAHSVSMALSGSVKLALAAGWSQEEAEAAADKVREEMRNGQVHAFMPFHVVYARKPAAR
jgi:ubiquinone/menaquinone biosynthesis C-methylase UbiE